ncbi:MAG: carboxypeptidase-like regulatory domain-containing protein, partial [Planctomycetota bacterium]
VRSVPGVHETVVPLVLEKSGILARLGIRLVDPGGSSIPRFTASLEDPVTGWGVASLTQKTKNGDGRLPPVPPGRYRLEVEPGYHIMGLTPYFPILREVEVHAGKENTVDLRAREGGRVRVTLRVSGEQPERLRDFELRADFAGGGSRPKIGPYVYRTETGWMGRWQARPGKPFICRRLLEPGRHSLHFQAAGYQPTRAVVDIEPGKTSDVVVRLLPD